MNRFLFRSSHSKQTLLVWFCLQFIFLLWTSASATAQGLGISGANVEAACPAACGISIRITSAKLRERSDGIDAVIDWTVEQRAPEIMLKSFNITAIVEFNRSSKDERTVSVAADKRQAVIKLQSGGFNKDIKFSDVTSVRAIVFATADALPSIPITDIRSIKIVGQSADPAVEASWGAPTPLACSASTFAVRVKAINEKGDLLDGNAEAAITARVLRVQLKGDINKKGLRNPEATVALRHSLIGCQQTTNFPPTQEGIGGGVGSSAPNPVVTLKPITFQPAGSRIDSSINWDVVEPTGFRATKFEIKVDTELTNGQIFTSTNTFSGSERSAFGSQSQNDLRSVTATIKATFANAANTQILFREDKRTDKFSAKAALLDIQKPVPTQGQAPNLGLSAEVAKIVSENNFHTVTVKFQAKPPSGITVTSFVVEATAQGNQNTVTRSETVLGQPILTSIRFPFAELGDKLKKVQVKVTATAQRANGSTFQQTATAEGQPVVPPPPPPPPPVQLKVDGLSATTGTNTLVVRGNWLIILQPGITIQDFIVEASVLKPTGPIKQTITVNAATREQNIPFLLANVSGATAVEMKVTANLRRADGTTFQETSVRQTNVGN